MLAGVCSDYLQRLASQTLASHLFGDEQSQLCPVVQRVKVQKIDGAHGRSVTGQSDDQTQLPLSIDVTRILL